MAYATLADRDAVGQRLSEGGLNIDTPISKMLETRAKNRPDAPALSYQLTSSVTEAPEVVTWSQMLRRVRQAANLFRAEGLAENDTIAIVLPNAPEAVFAMLGGMIATRVTAINPLLEPAQIAGLLRQADVRAVVTLAPTPRSDIYEKVVSAIKEAPQVQRVFTVDLTRHLSGAKRFVARTLVGAPRLKARRGGAASFLSALERQPHDRLTFAESPTDRTICMFHTGGTTGTPRMVAHRRSGVIFNALMAGIMVMPGDEEVLLCQLPLFHIFGVYIALMSCAYNGGHVVMISPSGYRAEGIFENLWGLIEKYRVTSALAVPTALSAMLQHKVNSDVSSLKQVLCGAAPLPVELFRRFQEETGVEVIEGYGLTEATCLVAGNPIDGEKRIGSVGFPVPLVDVRILSFDEAGRPTDVPTDTSGEICVRSPAVVTGEVYTDPAENVGLFTDDGFLRTGDLGRLDADGYLWITGRAKDIIIRGGHNIDPAIIENAAQRFPGIALCAAVGQPDRQAGEVPCLYIEPETGKKIDLAALSRHLEKEVPERAALPKHIDILEALPATAVGKIFKPALRHMAIRRVLDDTFGAAGLDARVKDVRADAKLGTLLSVEAGSDREKVEALMRDYALQWQFA